MPSASTMSRVVHAGTHWHPGDAYVYVIDGSVIFGLDDREPVVLKPGESRYEPPGDSNVVPRRSLAHPSHTLLRRIGS
jgi:hypothetical protein